jgi:SAM-dependent methyltransferase
MSGDRIANTEMAAAWAEEGERWARLADEHDRATAAHHRALMDAAAIAPSDRVLDIGCGNGWTTREAARAAPQGDALGLDISVPMLGRARELAAQEGLTNIEFLYGDAQVHAFAPGERDVAVSKFGSMFFGDPVAAFTNIHGALREGGRLALVVWQELARNEWLLVMRGAIALGRELPSPPPGAPGPFGLADPERTRDILTRARFHDIHVTPIAPAVVVGRDVDEAFEFARNAGPVQGALQGLDDGPRERALANLRDAVAARATADGVQLPSAAWLITAVA